MSDLINMHGFGIYVWPSYLITLAVFSLNIFNTLREKRKTQKLIRHYLLKSQK